MARGSFKKGVSGNPNGRPKGALNKSTEEMKKFISNVISENLDVMSEDFKRMSPATRWTLLEKFGKYVIPTLAQTTIEGEIKGDINIKITYDDDILNDDKENE